MNTSYSKYPQEQHPYHLVDQSPWPFMVSLCALNFTYNFVMYMHNYSLYGCHTSTALILLLFFVYKWFGDIVTESTFEGHHSWKVQKGLRYGMLLFIVSEVMFFFAFFWAFFYSSIAPAVEIGWWPPKGIEFLSPYSVPLLNTVILLSSGVSITWAHRAIVGGSRSQTLLGLFWTIVLGVIFTCVQALEYLEATFFINDGVYGSLFYLCTGFHGFHVLIGTTFLIVCFFRQLYYHFTVEQHLGFEAAAWYWHFVDVVWLFLYICIYWWSYN